MLSIHNALPTLNISRNLGQNLRAQSSAMEKLSSGLRINTAKDDPAGLVLSEKLESQIQGLERALRNTDEEGAVLDIMDGALSQVQGVLKTMKSLAIDSANTGVVSADRLMANQTEMDNCLTAINRIFESTEYGGRKLLDGMDLFGGNNVNGAGRDLTDTGPGAGIGGLELSDASSALAAGLSRDSSEASSLELVEGGEALEVEDPTAGMTEYEKKLYSLSNTLSDMNMNSIGSVKIKKGEDDEGNEIVKTYSLNDLYSGSDASLLRDPTLAMKVIEAADKDVGNVRAGIGATRVMSDHARMCKEAELESLTGLQAGIRDTDMAESIVDYQQATVLADVGTRMLREAVEQTKSVLNLFA